MVSADGPGRRLMRCGELLVVGVVSLLSPVVFVLGSGILIWMTKAPVRPSTPWRWRGALTAIGIVLIAAAIVLPFIPITSAWLPDDPGPVWCHALLQSWTLACAVADHRTGAAIVAVLALVLASVAAYRDVVQLDRAYRERTRQADSGRSRLLLLLASFLAWCFMNYAFGVLAAFTGHPPSGPIIDLAFFLTIMCVLAWAAYSLACMLFAELVAALR